jgi:hypothetical protein
MAESFLSYLKGSNKGLEKSSYIIDLSSRIVDLLKTLANIKYEEKSLEVFSECLKLNINNTADHQCGFVINTRFGKDNNLDPELCLL